MRRAELTVDCQAGVSGAEPNASKRQFRRPSPPAAARRRCRAACLRIAEGNVGFSPPNGAPLAQSEVERADGRSSAGLVLDVALEGQLSSRLQRALPTRHRIAVERAELEFVDLPGDPFARRRAPTRIGLSCGMYNSPLAVML
jgi:hypothetical protein